MTTHSQEIERGERFAFGENWRQFLDTLDESRIKEAETSLQEMLGLKNLSGKKFLDAGCGSGLFSLAARRLGAFVHSFDYDRQSVACAETLRERFYPSDSGWNIETGSVLDESYMRSVGEFDVVYSWGVLHHTGNMNLALTNIALPVKTNGLLFIAIYNDEDYKSNAWVKVKKIYCAGTIGRTAVKAAFLPVFALQGLAAGLIKYKNPFGYFANYKKKRGMSIYYDWIDWLGGYPFETAKPEEIFHFYKNLGFTLTNMVTTNKLGCNQFVFRREA